MQAEEFLKEVLESPICPDNFEAIYREFQRYQQLAMDTLKEFHRVCEKNNIPYQLAYGSLLGAIRDNGQIPWDYDIDVWVPYCEVPALIEALKKDLSSNYYFYCPEVDPKCRHYSMRLAPKGFRTEVLHVDVFYMIGVPNDEKARKLFIKQVHNVRDKRFGKLVKVWENYKHHPRLLMKFYKQKLQCAFVSLSNIDEKFHYLANKYSFEDAEYCTSLCGTSGRTFSTKDLWDTMLAVNNCGEFRITKNYDKFLRHMYGDYKKIFPLESRLKEMMSHYNSLRKTAREK